MIIAFFLAQPTKNLEEEIVKLGDHNNHPFIGVVRSDAAVEYFVVVERLILVRNCASFLDAVHDMMSAYFAFDIEYPQGLYALYIFLQHFVYSVKDRQRVPPAATRICSALHKITA